MAAALPKAAPRLKTTVATSRTTCIVSSNRPPSRESTRARALAVAQHNSKIRAQQALVIAQRSSDAPEVLQVAGSFKT